MKFLKKNNSGPVELLTGYVDKFSSLPPSIIASSHRLSGYIMKMKSPLRGVHTVELTLPIIRTKSTLTKRWC